jgi:hypothetical protein
MPLNWLWCIVVLAIFIGVGVHQYRTKLRYITPISKRRTAIMLLSLHFLYVEIFTFLAFLLAQPSIDRIGAWREAQFQRFLGQDCNLDVLWRVNDHLESIRAPWLWIGIPLMLVGAMVLAAVQQRYIRQVQAAAQTRGAGTIVDGV